MDCQLNFNNDEADDYLSVDVDEGLYRLAFAVVMRTKSASVSRLSRSLLIPYDTAFALVERMTDEGFLAEPDGRGRRAILSRLQRTWKMFIMIWVAL